MVTIPPPPGTEREGRSWFTGKRTNQGGPTHLKARDRIMQLLEVNGFTCTTGEKFWAASLKGELPYEPDVLAAKGDLQVVVEIDGKSHGSHRQAMKDTHRDDWFRNDPNGPHVKTVRFPQCWVIGKRKWTNRELMEFFWWKVDDC